MENFNEGQIEGLIQQIEQTDNMEYLFNTAEMLLVHDRKTNFIHTRSINGLLSRIIIRLKKLTYEARIAQI